MEKRKIDQYYDSQEGKRNKNKNERGGVDRNQQEGMLNKKQIRVCPCCEPQPPHASAGHPPKLATVLLTGSWCSSRVSGLSL